MQDIDLYKIILNLSEHNEKVSMALFKMITFILFDLTEKYQALQRKPLSIRDVVNCIDFIKVAGPLFNDLPDEEKMAMAIYHAV